MIETIAARAAAATLLAAAAISCGDAEHAPAPPSAAPPPQEGPNVVLPVEDPAALATILERSSRGAGARGPVAPARARPDPMSFVEMQPDLKASNAGIERDLRATLYFELVDQCRDEDGRLLPPDAVEIEFRVDARGAIDRSSVRASAALPEHEAAARCMVRVIRTANTRFSSGRLDEPTRVQALVPSVD